MATQRLENYLRTHRKRSGLTQREIAFLLGWKTGGSLGRYEKRRRLPPLKTALACEEIFGVPVSELFAGIRQAVGRDIEKRRVVLRASLQTKTANLNNARMTAHKLRWLEDREHSVVAHHNAPTT